LADEPDPEEDVADGDEVPAELLLPEPVTVPVSEPVELSADVLSYEIPDDELLTLDCDRPEETVEAVVGVGCETVGVLTTD